MCDCRGGTTGGMGGSSPPYSWCINGNMERVWEKKRWTYTFFIAIHNTNFVVISRMDN